jgi:hypothetical protein
MSNDDVRAIWSDAQLDTALATFRSEVDIDLSRLADDRAKLVGSVGGDLRGGVRDDDVVTPIAEVPSRRRPSWWMASAAAVVLVAAITLATQLVPGDQGPTPAGNGAAELLERAAANAKDAPIAPGQYRYVAEHEWFPRGAAYRQGSAQPPDGKRERSTEAWIPQDWHADWMRRSKECFNVVSLEGDPLPPEQWGCLPPAEQPHESVRPCGTFTPEWECGEPGYWTLPNQPFVDSLPRDPIALRERLFDDYENYLRRVPEAAGIPKVRPEQRVLSYAGDLLKSGMVPADLRAALYRMIATIPRFTVTDPRASLDGRRGVAFGFEENGIRREIVIEPSTGEFIGTRQVYLRGGRGVPAGLEFYSSVSTAVVDEMGQRPR